MNTETPDRFFDLAMMKIAGQASDAELTELEKLMAQEPGLKEEYEQLAQESRLLNELIPLAAATQATEGEFPEWARPNLQREVKEAFGRPLEEEGPITSLLIEAQRLLAEVETVLRVRERLKEETKVRVDRPLPTQNYQAGPAVHAAPADPRQATVPPGAGLNMEDPYATALGAAAPCRVSALCETALDLIKAGDKNPALVVLKQALEVAQEIEESWKKTDALREIVSAFVEAGEFRQAVKVAQEIEDGGDKATALREIALDLIKAGDKNQALVVLKQAVEVVQGIGYSYNKTCIVREIALALIKMGEFKQALEVVQKIEDAGDKAKALCETALDLVKAGDMKQALEVAQEIENAWDKANALREIGLALIEAGDKKQALVVLKQAVRIELEAAKEIEDAKTKSEALGGTALALIKAGDKKQALDVLKQAVEAAQEVLYPWDKADALREIALALGMAGDKEQALVVFKQAVKAAKEIENEEFKASTLRKIIASLEAKNPPGP